MKVSFHDTTYHVSFTNISEKIIHDAMPADLQSALVSMGLLEEVVQPAKTPGLRLSQAPRPPAPPHVHYRFKKFVKPFLKLKEPRRISTTTTLCTISNENGGTLATGRAFYSKSETVFNNTKARAKAFGRAMASWDTLSFASRHEFTDAYDRALKDRHAKVARSRGAALPPHGAETRLSSSSTHSAVVQRSEGR